MLIKQRECDFASFSVKREDVRECGQRTACTSGVNPTVSSQFRTQGMNHRGLWPLCSKAILSLRR